MVEAGCGGEAGGMGGRRRFSFPAFRFPDLVQSQSFQRKKEKKPSIAPSFASDSPVRFFFPLIRLSATTIDYAPFPGHEASHYIDQAYC